MVACCAHHVTDVLPIVGVSLAATFLTTWKTPLMGLGLAANFAGIAAMLWLIRRDRRRHAGGH
jgi:predicted outer membrane lipoprotein